MPGMRPGGDWGPWPEPPQVLESQQPEEELKGLGIAGPH